jgi:hypothetical protein
LIASDLIAPNNRRCRDNCAVTLYKLVTISPANRRSRLFAALAFECGDFVGDFRNPLLKLCFGAVLDVTFAKTIARYMQLKLGLEFLALDVEMFEMAVSHCEPRFR